MKILFIVSAYYPDGAGSGRSVRSLAEGVHKAGHEAVVIRLSKDQSYSWTVIDGVKVYSVPLRNIYQISDRRKKSALCKMLWHMIDVANPFAFWDLCKILKQEKPDVVNTSVISGFSTSALLAVKVLGIPLVHTLRDYYLMCSQNAMFRNGKSCRSVCGKCRPFFTMRRVFSKCPDLYLSNSDYVKKKHESLGFLPKSVSCDVQFNMNGDDHIRDARFFPAARSFKFGFIGRITDTKGVEILLQSLKDLQFENWTLTIAGQGSDKYVEELKSIYPDERILFLGFVNPDSFYEEIDALICPSVYEEPLPRVVYEAYKAALPVIVSDAGGTPEIVDEEQTGFVYEAQDPQALARYMSVLGMSKDLYERLSQGAAEKAKIFTCTAITRQFIAHLERIRKA